MSLNHNGVSDIGIGMENVASNDNLPQIGEILRTETHDQILSKLKDIQLGDLCSYGDKNKKIGTVYAAILSEATNGDQLIIHKLNESVTWGGNPDINSKDSYISVDLRPLIRRKGKQSCLVKAMIAKQTTATRALLTHPVIETFLDLKWSKVKYYFLVNFLIYCLFLVTYSAFLGNIFWRGKDPKYVSQQNFKKLLQGIGDIPKGTRIVFPNDAEETTTIPPFFGRRTTTNSKDEFAFATFNSTNLDPTSTDRNPSTRQPITTTSNQKGINKYFTFRKCRSKPSLTCFLEVALLILTIILTLQEFLQIFTLGLKGYFSEFENILELFCYSLVYSGLILQNDGYVLKWISAFGICIAYVELIFMIGRYPMLGGSISLMFYNIIRRLFRALSSFLILIIGFGFGFFIMHHRSSFDTFENPLKAIFKTLVMSVGEFEFLDLYHAHEEDPYALAFTLALLLALITMATLVLINLLIAMIVSDLQELRSSGHIQALVNKAQHVVQIEETMSSFICPFSKPPVIDELIQVCGHSQCNCNYEKLEPDIVNNLVKIAKKHQMNKYMSNSSKILDNSSSNYKTYAKRNSLDNQELIQELLRLIMENK